MLGTRRIRWPNVDRKDIGPRAFCCVVLEMGGGHRQFSGHRFPWNWQEVLSSFQTGGLAGRNEVGCDASEWRYLAADYAVLFIRRSTAAQILLLAEIYGDSRE